jgi:hypothetical protein
VAGGTPGRFAYEHGSRFQVTTEAEGRRRLSGALSGRSGLHVWVPVHEEGFAVRRLLDAGYAVLGGERFRLRTPPAVRVTTAQLPGG